MRAARRRGGVRGAAAPRASAAAGALVLLALMLAAGPAAADSLYSLRGDGESVSAARADARALGGAEIASDIPSLSRNPASLSFADRTTFYGTYELEWMRTEEHLPAGGGPVRKEYENLVPNLALIFPLPGELTLGTGLLIQRRRGATIDLTAETPNGNGGTVTYKQEYEASGSLLQIPAMLAWDGGFAQVGAGVDFILLGSDFTWRNEFPGEGDALNFVDSEDSEENNLTGVAFRAGVRVPVRDWLAVGAYTALPSKLDGERRFSTTQTGSAGEQILDRSADIAPAWGVGLEVRPTPDVRVATDWVRESWTKADALSPGDVFTDVDKVAVGVEWKRTGERGSVAWPVRAGYRTQQLHTLDVYGMKVREHVLSAGSGFNIAGGRGDIDWYLEYGWRGRKDATEFLEHFVRFGLTLTGKEKWGRLQRPTEDDDW